MWRAKSAREFVPFFGQFGIVECDFKRSSIPNFLQVIFRVTGSICTLSSLQRVDAWGPGHMAFGCSHLKTVAHGLFNDFGWREQQIVRMRYVILFWPVWSYFAVNLLVRWLWLYIFNKMVVGIYVAEVGIIPFPKEKKHAWYLCVCKAKNILTG